MITVGLIKEFSYISLVTKSCVEVVFRLKYPLLINIYNNVLTLNYNNNLIWKESLEEATSCFGLESCTTINNIITLINNGADGWLKYVYIESPS